MSKSSKSLNDLLHEIRRIEESREVLTKKKIRAIYKQLLKELTAFIAETYTKYSDENGTLTVAGLQRSAKLAWFLNEIDKNCNEYLPDVSKEIQKLIDTVYEESRIYLAIQLFKKNIPDSLEINVNYFFIRLTFISLAYDNFINQIKKHILI